MLDVQCSGFKRPFIPVKNSLRFGMLFMLLAVLPFAFSCGPGEGPDKKSKPLVEFAPDFTLETPEGEKVSMKDLKGSPVFLNFWASWCRPCREEMPDIEKIHQVYGKKGLKVYAVNAREDKETIGNFRKSTGAGLPILLDATGDVMKLYKIFGLPVSYFIDKEGKVAASIMGKMAYEDMDIQVNGIL